MYVKYNSTLHGPLAPGAKPPLSVNFLRKYLTIVKRRGRQVSYRLFYLCLQKAHDREGFGKDLRMREYGVRLIQRQTRREHYTKSGILIKWREDYPVISHLHKVVSSSTTAGRAASHGTARRSKAKTQLEDFRLQCMTDIRGLLAVT